MSYYPIYKECLFCKEQFDARGGQRGVTRALGRTYCSRQCVARHRATFVVGPNHHGWKHGLKVNKNGYISQRTYAGPSHAYITKGLHRIVVERFIGRKLSPGDEVHHKNEDKHDNRIENLQVLSKSEHARLHGKQRNHLNAATLS